MAPWESLSCNNVPRFTDMQFHCCVDKDTKLIPAVGVGVRPLKPLQVVVFEISGDHACLCVRTKV